MDAASVGAEVKKVISLGRRWSAEMLERAKPLAEKTQGAVTSGIHTVMGSGEYRQKAMEVNQQLAVAVLALEDAIVRRDEEISRLRTRVAELENNQGHG